MRQLKRCVIRFGGNHFNFFRKGKSGRIMDGINICDMLEINHQIDQWKSRYEDSIKRIAELEQHIIFLESELCKLNGIINNFNVHKRTPKTLEKAWKQFEKERTTGIRFSNTYIAETTSAGRNSINRARDMYLEIASGITSDNLTDIDLINVYKLSEETAVKMYFEIKSNG